MSKIRLQLAGFRFGKWFVVDFAGFNKRGSGTWNCLCDCGNENVVIGSELKSGSSQSCGCLKIQVSTSNATTHGMKYTPLYNVYRGMKDRCYNKNCAAYKNYGGRGIEVCKEWFDDFVNFYNDMSEGYQPHKVTIERKEVNKNYSKENCIWIPREQQSRNRTNTIWITTEKGVMTITEAAKLANVSWFCMYNRYERKCPIEKLLLPARKAGRSFTNV